ncbi:restriction endonuclease subunit S [Thioalkalivibrio sp. ALM2T]|uniref:restriction endonuclease subunit S n=1 Tax=Thioalkalivibrio sp. ALM2T TaxID=1158184 RepID=UPI00039DE0DC|nr:restriction endonuclease subunit S [Thioalkalivibrio sp. ALM2T]
MCEQYENAPEGWQVRRLDDLAASITSGGTPTAGSSRYYTSSGGLPFAKTEDLSRAVSKYLEDCDLQITEAALKETSAKRYPEGTILVSMYGTIGLTKITAKEMAANQALCALLEPFCCSADFLYHQLDFIRPRWSRFSGQTTQANISGSIVRAAKVLLPPPNEQRFIARILDTLDTQIQKTEALIAKLEKVKEGLLHDLLTRGINENGQLRPSPEQAPELYKESPLGLIPREWSTCSLGELAKLQGGFAFPSGEFGLGGIPIVRMSNLKSGRLDLSDAVTVSDHYLRHLGGFRLHAGDLVLGMSGSIETWAVVSENDIPSLLNQRVGRFKILDEERLVYRILDLIVKSQYYQDHLRRESAGAAQLNISSSQVESTKIPVPPLYEQRRILGKYGALEKRIGQEELLARKLYSQKNAILDDLLTGRVRVTPLLDEAQGATPA